MSKILAIIPARSGSKGIKNKNIKPLNNRPLIDHTIDFAKNSNYINKLVVSTNDKFIINNYSNDKGIEIIVRPEYLCEDDSLVIDTIRHVLNNLKLNQSYIPDVIILLETTSPLRSHSDLNKAVKKVINGFADSSTAFKKSSISPNRMWKIKNEDVEPYINDSSPFLSRQNQPEAFELTGQFYVISNSILQKETKSISLLKGRVYPIVSSTKFSFDIDTEDDFLIVEQIFKYLNEK